MALLSSTDMAAPFLREVVVLTGRRPVRHQAWGREPGFLTAPASRPACAAGLRTGSRNPPLARLPG